MIVTICRLKALAPKIVADEGEERQMNKKNTG
jgi:hypothetical protein